MHSIQYQQQEERLYRRDDKAVYYERAKMLVENLITIISDDAYNSWCETLPNEVINWRSFCDMLQAEIDKAIAGDCGCVIDTQSCPTCNERAAEVYSEIGE